ncbi:Centrosomal protein of 192 kDa, partial [Camelus dromedarius]
SARSPRLSACAVNRRKPERRAVRPDPVDAAGECAHAHCLCRRTQDARRSRLRGPSSGSAPAAGVAGSDSGFYDSIFTRCYRFEVICLEFLLLQNQLFLRISVFGAKITLVGEMEDVRGIAEESFPSFLTNSLLGNSGILENVTLSSNLGLPVAVSTLARSRHSPDNRFCDVQASYLVEGRFSIPLESSPSSQSEVEPRERLQLVFREDESSVSKTKNRTESQRLSDVVLREPAFQSDAAGADEGPARVAEPFQSRRPFDGASPLQQVRDLPVDSRSRAWMNEEDKIAVPDAGEQFEERSPSDDLSHLSLLENEQLMSLASLEESSGNDDIDDEEFYDDHLEAYFEQLAIPGMIYEDLEGQEPPEVCFTLPTSGPSQESAREEVLVKTLGAANAKLNPVYFHDTSARKEDFDLVDPLKPEAGSPHQSKHLTAEAETALPTDGCSDPETREVSAQENVHVAALKPVRDDGVSSADALWPPAGEWRTCEYYESFGKSKDHTDPPQSVVYQNEEGRWVTDLAYYTSFNKEEDVNASLSNELNEDFRSGSEALDLIAQDEEDFNKEHQFLQEENMDARNTSVALGDTSWGASVNYSLLRRSLSTSDLDKDDASYLRLSLGEFFAQRSEALGCLGGGHSVRRPSFGYFIRSPEKREPVALIRESDTPRSNLEKGTALLNQDLSSDVNAQLSEGSVTLQAEELESVSQVDENDTTLTASKGQTEDTFFVDSKPQRHKGSGGDSVLRVSTIAAAIADASASADPSQLAAMIRALSNKTREKTFQEHDTWKGCPTKSGFLPRELERSGGSSTLDMEKYLRKTEVSGCEGGLETLSRAGVSDIWDLSLPRERTPHDIRAVDGGAAGASVWGLEANTAAAFCGGNRGDESQMSLRTVEAMSSVLTSTGERGGVGAHVKTRSADCRSPGTGDGERVALGPVPTSSSYSLVRSPRVASLWLSEERKDSRRGGQEPTQRECGSEMSTGGKHAACGNPYLVSPGRVTSPGHVGVQNPPPEHGGRGSEDDQDSFRPSTSPLSHSSPGEASGTSVSGYALESFAAAAHPQKPACERESSQLTCPQASVTRLTYVSEPERSTCPSMASERGLEGHKSDVTNELSTTIVQCSPVPSEAQAEDVLREDSLFQSRGKRALPYIIQKNVDTGKVTETTSLSSNPEDVKPNLRWSGELASKSEDRSETSAVGLTSDPSESDQSSLARLSSSGPSLPAVPAVPRLPTPCQGSVDRGEGIASEGRARLPEALGFPHACCVGIASQTLLSVLNPGDRWLQASVRVLSVSVDGEKVDLSAYPCLVFKNQVIIRPQSTEEIKVLFMPSRPGIFRCIFSVASWPFSADAEAIVQAEALASRVVLTAVAETPVIEIETEKKDVLDFGDLAHGGWRALPLKLVNRTHAAVPVRLVISANATAWRCFTFSREPVHAAAGALPYATVITQLAAPSVVTHMMPASYDGQDPEFLIIWVLFHSPKKQIPSSEILDSAEEFLARVDVELDSPNATPVITSVSLRARAGVARIHAPKDLQTMHLFASVASSAKQCLPLKNAGNIDVYLDIEIPDRGSHFSVDPGNLFLKPGEEQEVTVSFTLKDPEAREERLQKLALRNNSTSAAQHLRLLIRGQDQDCFQVMIVFKLQLQHTFGSEERLTSSCEIRIRPKEDIYVSVLFAPTRLSCMLAKLEIKQLGIRSQPGIKFTIPLSGYGGTSNLILEDVKKLSDSYMVAVNDLVPGRESRIVFSVRNTGSRAAFVKAVGFKDSQKKVLLDPKVLRIFPDKFVLKERTQEDVTIIYTPSDRESSSNTTTELSTVYFFGGDEISRQQYRRALLHKPGIIEQVLAGYSVLQKIDFAEAFQDELLVTEVYDLPQRPNDIQLFYGNMRKIVLSVIGEFKNSISNRELPPSSKASLESKSEAGSCGKHGGNVSLDVLPVKGPQGPPLPSRAVRPPQDRLASEETWAVQPEHLILVASSCDLAKTGRFQIVNNCVRLLRFELHWPAHCLTVTPPHGFVAPESKLQILVSPNFSFSMKQSVFPWSGFVYVHCDSGQKKIVKVQIREDLTTQELCSRVASSPFGALSSGPEPAAHHLVRPGTKPPSTKVEIRNKTVTFPATEPGETSENHLDLENPGDTDVRWHLSSLAPPYVKGADESGGVFRATYAAFRCSPVSGLLESHGTQTVSVTFLPRDRGDYAQFWDVECHPLKEPHLKHTLRFQLCGQSIPAESEPERARVSAHTLVKVDNLAKARRRAVSEASAPIPGRQLDLTHRGVYAPEDVYQFLPTRVGESRTLKVNLRNNSFITHSLKFLSPREPFYVKHSKYSLRAQHYINMPVQFRPRSVGRFEALLVVQTDEGRSVAIRLVGEAFEKS